MKISAMKRGMVAILSLFLFYAVKAQTPVNVPDPPYVKNPGLPPFSLLEVDSIHYITNNNLKKNRKVLIMFFSPECEHCKHQMRDILDNFSQFKDIQIVMATFQPFNEMKAFYTYFRIGDHANIHMGRDEHYMLPPFFRMQSLPYLALYDKKGQLIAHFEGNQKIDTIMNAFQGKGK